VSFAVLVVDDDFRVARLHARLVEDVPDFRVVGVAHTAEQTRHLVAEHSPDLVLLDNYLPDQQGVELATQLGCDVLMVTADSSARSTSWSSRSHLSGSRGSCLRTPTTAGCCAPPPTSSASRGSTGRSPR
jgi:DNA-binding NarL/FixJ family response regulator